MSDREENKEDSVVGSKLPRHRMPLGRADENVLSKRLAMLFGYETDDLDALSPINLPFALKCVQASTNL